MCQCLIQRMCEVNTQNKNDKNVPKRLSQLLCPNRLIAVLELIEHPLQGEGNTFRGIISLSGHHIHRLESKNKSYVTDAQHQPVLFI